MYILYYIRITYNDPGDDCCWAEGPPNKTLVVSNQKSDVFTQGVR